MNNRSLKYIFVSAFVLLFIAISAFAASAADVGTVTGSVVNVRSGPGTSYKILTKLSKDTKVDVLETLEGWYKIEYKSTVGYVSSDYLAVEAGQASIAAVSEESTPGVVTGSSVRFRSAPSTSASIISTLSKNTSVDVIGTEGDWVIAVYGGKTGYIYAEYISYGQPSSESVYGRITGNGVRFRSAPSTDSNIILNFDYGTIVKIVSADDSWFETEYNGSTGYVSADYIERADQSVSRSYDNDILKNEIVNYAKNFLGVKYVYGGTSPSGFDCSGLVYYVLKHFDITLPRGATGQYNATTKINRSSLQLGDLVFFRSPGSKKIQHVGIYISNGDFIHSSSPGDVVKISTMDSGYYNTYYYGSTRYLR